jgi:hypothetical protein
MIAAVVTAGWLFALSGWVGAIPGEPVGSRIDAYFQNDAGGRIADAVAGTNARAAVVHPLFFFVFTLPIHLLTKLLAGMIAPEVTALYAGRVYAAVAAGVGIGRLSAALVRAGVSPIRLAMCAPLLLLGTSQTLASLPDHFALSFGVLSAAFGVFLDDRNGFGRHTWWKLVGLTALAGGITVTNVVFPAGLIAWRWVAKRGSIPRWVWPTVAVVLAGGVAFGGWVSRFDPNDHSNPLVWRVRGYLSGRVLNDPGGAAARAFRGFVDVTVGPTPAIDTNNYYKYPMLTYEPTTAAYSAWPYDAVQGIAVGVWLGLLATTIGLAIRDPHTRWPAVVLLGWAGGNVVFHVLWGDEFFLYTPHYSWAVATVAVIGLRQVPVWVTLPAVLVIAVGQGYTLVRIREAVGMLGS